MNLTPRENLLRLWRREGFEEIPVQFDLCPSQQQEFIRRYGEDNNYGVFYRFPWKDLSVSFLRQDFTAWAERYFPGRQFNPGMRFDCWGVGHEPTPESMHMTRMYHPMKTFDSMEQFQAYPYPEFDPVQRTAARTEVAAIHAAGLAASVSMACTVWEISWYLRGMEEMMVGMLTDDPMTLYHLDRLTDLACRRVGAYVEAGIDHLHLGDDIGMQHTIMMSLEDYRRWFKPRLQRIIAAARRVNPKIIISYHSCGYVTPFIPDLIEAGIDVLNPVQPECMDFAAIHAEYGNVLSFWGTLGTQTTMPFGTPDEVRRTVLANLEIAGAAGGLLCTPTHLVEPEVPWANIEAYVGACREFTV